MKPTATSQICAGIIEYLNILFLPAGLVVFANGLRYVRVGTPLPGAPKKGCLKKNTPASTPGLRTPYLHTTPTGINRERVFKKAQMIAEHVSQVVFTKPGLQYA